jgi:hypothetical protein
MLFINMKLFSMVEKQMDTKVVDDDDGLVYDMH